MSPTPFLRLARLRLVNHTIKSLPLIMHSTRTRTIRISISIFIPQPQPLTRNFSSTPPPQSPRKDSQHKDSINTEATEYSKSGTDDAAAREEEVAFDPSVTSPEMERKRAGKGKGKGGKGGEGKANPLDVSPANTEVSRQRDPMEGGVENSPRGK
ncbi:hypothetical protein NHQ30_000842 [Ciborinia camelliae]|nr:hypothetical protein NHQ30_000842 [Ciborinia camelliae]